MRLNWKAVTGCTELPDKEQKIGLGTQRANGFSPTQQLTGKHLLQKSGLRRLSVIHVHLKLFPRPYLGEGSLRFYKLEAEASTNLPENLCGTYSIQVSSSHDIVSLSTLRTECHPCTTLWAHAFSLEHMMKFLCPSLQYSSPFTASTQHIRNSCACSCFGPVNLSRLGNDDLVWSEWFNILNLPLVSFRSLIIGLFFLTLN